MYPVSNRPTFLANQHRQSFVYVIAKNIIKKAKAIYLISFFMLFIGKQTPPLSVEKQHSQVESRYPVMSGYLHP